MRTYETDNAMLYVTNYLNGRTRLTFVLSGNKAKWHFTFNRPTGPGGVPVRLPGYKHFQKGRLQGDQ